MCDQSHMLSADRVDCSLPGVDLDSMPSLPLNPSGLHSQSLTERFLSKLHS